MTEHEMWDYLDREWLNMECIEEMPTEEQEE